MKLDVKAFALACGILWGLGVFVLAWWMIMQRGMTGEATTLGAIYIGFNLSVAGSLIGLAWGFVDGVIGGGLLAWLYNKLSKN